MQESPENPNGRPWQEAHSPISYTHIYIYAFKESSHRQQSEVKQIEVIQFQIEVAISGNINDMRWADYVRKGSCYANEQWLGLQKLKTKIINW